MGSCTALETVSEEAEGDVTVPCLVTVFLAAGTLDPLHFTMIRKMKEKETKTNEMEKYE